MDIVFLFIIKEGFIIYSQLKKAVLNRDMDLLKDITVSIEETEDWDFVSFIDELLPIMLMESNLKYGSFHFVKMSLFLRKMSFNDHFSKDTEWALLKLILNNITERHWVYLKVGLEGYKEDKISGNTAEKMIDELHKSNIHNAYYYSLGLYKYAREDLCQLLLDLGSVYIPDTLGHSISCFYPVIKDIIDTNHPATATALFSLIAYLGRFDYEENVLDQKLHDSEPDDYNKLLKKSASGKGIVNLHHMITFYIMTDWGKAAFNSKGIVPFKILTDWVDDKEIDRELEKEVSEIDISENITSYQLFSNVFSPEDLKTSAHTLIYLLDTEPERAVDWVFRRYTDFYTPDWDPHYYTSLFCAIRLYFSNDKVNKTACRMAIYQAVQYFFEGIN